MAQSAELGKTEPFVERHDDLMVAQAHCPARCDCLRL
jgi:hypothetical protein